MKATWPRVLRILLWLAVCGGSVAGFLLALLIGCSVQFGLASIVGEPFPALLAGGILVVCLLLALLTALRLLGKGWHARAYAWLMAGMAAALLPLFFMPGDSIRSMLITLGTPVGIALAQGAGHWLLSRANDAT